jgi:hypothetical protein
MVTARAGSLAAADGGRTDVNASPWVSSGEARSDECRRERRRPMARHWRPVQAR